MRDVVAGIRVFPHHPLPLRSWAGGTPPNTARQAVAAILAAGIVLIPASRHDPAAQTSVAFVAGSVSTSSADESGSESLRAGTEWDVSALEQRVVATFIARRYRVADHAAVGFVETAYRAGSDFRVDPLLILAVAAIESSYNPVAESFMGAKGLMQIIPKYHQEKLREHGGEESLFDPSVNITVGTKILREYLRRYGATERALQVYGGAFDEPTQQYANKVLAERLRIQQTVRRWRAEQG